jgi:hypothetical protein
VKVSLSTGGDQDFLQLIPETLEEAASLVEAAQSQFVEDQDRMRLLTIQFPQKNIELRVALSKIRPKHIDSAMRDALDATA